MTNEYIKCIEGTSNLILTMPHSTRKIPQGIEHKLNLENGEVKRTLASGTDFCVPYVTGFHKYKSATRIYTEIPRVVLDVNRHVSAADKFAVEGGNENLDPHGLIWRASMTNNEKNIVPLLKRLYTEEEFHYLLSLGYYPYHNALKNAVMKAKEKHGIVINFDLHSMPGNKVGYVKSGKYKGAYLFGDKMERGSFKDGKMPDLGLVRLEPETCSEEICNMIIDNFTQSGILIESLKMRPGKISPREEFANPKENIHSIGIEIIGHNFEPHRMEGKYDLDLRNTKKFRKAFKNVFKALEDITV